MSLVSKAFSDIITFSRSSNATRVGPTGLVEYAPHNLLLRSQEFDNASWSKTRSSITANAIAAPDGTVTADKLVEDTSNNTHFCVQGVSLGGSVDSSKFVFSIFAKAGERSRLSIYDNNQNTSGGTTFNLSTGAVVTGNGTITSVGNGWYRCAIYPLKDFSTTSNLYVLLDNGSTSSYAGDGTSGIYLWGAQLSVGPYPLDYTPTTSAAVYGPRFDYDPVTLAAKGLLVEESRSNLVTYSEDLSNAAWSKSGATISANSAASPDGQTTADKIVENSATSNHEVFQSVSITSGTAYTLSFFAKAAGRDYVACGHNGTSSYVYSYFNLANGTVVSSGSGHTTSIQSFGNGWYRVTSTFTAGVTASVAFEILASDNGSRLTYAGDGSSGVLIWGAQLEAGSFATSYLPTIASTVTRSADVASVDTLSPWFNATEGSFLGEFEVRGLLGGLLVANDGTDNYASSIIFGEFASSNSYGLRVFVSTTAQADFSTSDPAVNSVQKFAGGFKANDFGFTKNGAAASTDTSGSIPTAATNMRIGRSWTGANANMWIRRIAFYPRKLSSAELQALTA